MKLRLNRKLVHQLERDPAEWSGSRESLDIAPVMQVLGLSEKEAAYLHARSALGLRLADLPGVLGVTPKQVDAIRKRVHYRIKKLRRDDARKKAIGPRLGCSTHLSVQESLPEGSRVWALAELPDVFQEIMDAEKKYWPISPKA